MKVERPDAFDQALQDWGRLWTPTVVREEEDALVASGGICAPPYDLSWITDANRARPWRDNFGLPVFTVPRGPITFLAPAPVTRADLMGLARKRRRAARPHRVVFRMVGRIVTWPKRRASAAFDTWAAKRFLGDEYEEHGW